MSLIFQLLSGLSGVFAGMDIRGDVRDDEFFFPETTRNLPNLDGIREIGTWLHSQCAQTIKFVYIRLGFSDYTRNRPVILYDNQPATEQRACRFCRRSFSPGSLASLISLPPHEVSQFSQFLESGLACWENLGDFAGEDTSSCQTRDIAEKSTQTSTFSSIATQTDVLEVRGGEIFYDCE